MGRNELSYVITTISIPKEQSRFLKDNGYSPSRLFQNQVSKLMKLSEGHDMRVAQPSDELQRSSN